MIRSTKRVTKDEQLETLKRALTDAREVLLTAKRYFPKSIRNADRFHLNNILANSIDPALRKVEK